MPRLQIMDTTIRDGQQSLWATRMQIGDMLPILPKMDRVGYWAIEAWGGATFDTCLRFLDENPWELSLIHICFTAMISVSLGIMNLLPSPPLDGGRFVVEVFQKVSRRVVSTRALNYLSAAGMLLFLGFFLIMANQDIQRFVFGNW